MGNKAQIKLEYCQIGSEYWVVNGHWSFTVEGKDTEGLFVKHVRVSMYIRFNENDTYTLEEYN